MSEIFVSGCGAVSPAGWGVAALSAALAAAKPVPSKPLARPGWDPPLWVRPVPPPAARPAFLGHPRMRRAGAVSQFAVGAALEALGDRAPCGPHGPLRLGIVICLMAGGVSYSRRFYEETLRDPATASPLIFPETVFNAPASHLAAYLGSSAASYTLVGDQGMFLQGLALGAQWLVSGTADACVVVGAEELDWIVSDAMRLFQRTAAHSEGAGALYLRKERSAASDVRLASVTDASSFTSKQTRRLAAGRMRAQMPGMSAKELLCVGTQRLPPADAAELAAWRDWTGPRLAPKEVLGEAFNAAAAWQCVAACDAIQRREFAAANVSVVGANQQAIGARFTG